ncbi:MAG: hypothetical protein HY063_04240 [Bacteroidetes bacterium]|nr:hypothetical protein [Bacteroidota bacterium]
MNEYDYYKREQYRKQRIKKIIQAEEDSVRENYQIIYNFLKSVGKNFARDEKIKHLKEFELFIDDLPEPKNAKINCCNLIFWSVLMFPFKWLATYEDLDGNIMGEIADKAVQAQKLMPDDRKQAQDCSLFRKYNKTLFV